jgi:hypothetical protein
MRLEVIIKDKQSGEVLCNKECDSVICGYSGEERELVNNSGVANLHQGSGFSLLMAIEAAEEAVERAKEKACLQYKEVTGTEISWDEIKQRLGECTAGIKIDEDAIREMMGFDDDDE